MKNLLPYVGLTLVVLGVITFAVGYATGLTDINAVLFAGLAFVIIGIIAHVAIMKRQSEY